MAFFKHDLFRVPILPKFKQDHGHGRLSVINCENALNNTFASITDWLNWMNVCTHDTYCAWLEILTSEQGCLENSILEIWGYDYDYSSITRQEILDKINQEEISGIFGPIDLAAYLTPIKDSGRIIGATSLTISWYGETNTSAITEEDLAAAADGIPVRIC